MYHKKETNKKILLTKENITMKNKTELMEFKVSNSEEELTKKQLMEIALKYNFLRKQDFSDSIIYYLDKENNLPDDLLMEEEDCIKVTEAIERYKKELGECPEADHEFYEFLDETFNENLYEGTTKLLKNWSDAYGTIEVFDSPQELDSFMDGGLKIQALARTLYTDEPVDEVFEEFKKHVMYFITFIDFSVMIPAEKLADIKGEFLYHRVKAFYVENSTCKIIPLFSN